MNINAEKEVGRVILVGAGPGDPGLITARGLEWLRKADIVVFDALASRILLDQAPDHAPRIDVGKRAKRHKLTQDETNQLLVDKAKSRIGDRWPIIVRLKGGDPYLFGRGAEEATFCAQHGVPCEVVPGVTSGIAAPMMAGIPVTHRKVASTVTFVTGHEDPSKDETSVDYGGLAGLIKKGGTACFYMGVGRLGAISTLLQSHGVSGETPVAVVQWGTMPIQRHVVSTLALAESDVQAAGITAPAIIVVGDVAATKEPGLDFFTSRPLFGKCIIVTRTRHQASDLSSKLRDLGAMVIEAPTIALEPPASWNEFDHALSCINEYDWLVLTSTNGVAALKERMVAAGFDSRHLSHVRIAAIGDATARAIEDQLFITPDLVPTRFVAESLAGELIAKHDVNGKRFLLMRADIARPALPKLLAEAGAIVEEVVAYETKLADGLPDQALDALRQRSVDYITFTSSSTAGNMVELLGDERDLLNDTAIASIGPITSRTIQDLGLAVAFEAEQSNIEGLVQAIVSHQ